MTQKELRKLKKTELLEMMIALRNELDRVQAERDALQEQLKTAEQNALHQVETDAVLAVQKILKAVEDETAAYRKRIQVRLAHASLARKHGDNVLHLGKAVLLELRGSSLAAGGGCMLARSHGTSFRVEPGCGPGERLVCPYCTHHARAERRSLNVVVSHHDVRAEKWRY